MTETMDAWMVQMTRRSDGLVKPAISDTGFATFLTRRKAAAFALDARSHIKGWSFRVVRCSIAVAWGSKSSSGSAS